MPDPFDPAEFDAPPPSDPGADYRTLLDAMRKAGAEGVAQQVAALAQKIEQDARQRAEWTAQAGVGVSALHRAAGELQRVSAGVWWDRLKEWITTALIGLGLIFAAALAYRWAQEPKIERQLYGCTAKWDAKAQTCKGKWVPLYEQQP
ncbi:MULTISPECIES: hypothetical protein [Sphingomonadaceae]|jgi:hypothetical protein|nr:MULTISPECIES: hypothetical protein [Sphingomonadaceae]HAZ61625.1 hypothetical protein [Gammaproteobacteria bacterium]KMS50641.1 hypothetical protein V475_23080 [Sphingobium baderi LL03]MBB4050343.1 hypothetical protein [Sphingomonas zeae]MDK8188393.1 hypothetical protein [Sphingomonas zeae]MDK8218298.1 hypothetical protein [Sphingomonas sp. UMB7805-LC452B]